MAMTRAKRLKALRPPEPQSSHPQQPIRSPRLLHSLAAFITLFLLIFIHQCLVPLSTHFKMSHFYHHTSLVQGNKPTSWFTQTAHAASNLTDTAETVFTNGSATLKLIAKNVQNSSVHPLASLPDGPYPLTPISTNASESHIYAGASWTGSLARGILSALPLHWVAEMMHRPPETQDEGDSTDEREKSIFTARRKGAWIGCEREFHLVCKGIYRAIKVTNAIRVVDVGCAGNIGWLPHVVNKLRTEFRMVTLVCAVGTAEEEGKVRKLYGTVEGVNVLVLDAYANTFPNETDLLLAYRFLEKETLIDAMRFFKNVNKGGTVSALALESYPASRNAPGRNGGEGKLTINTALAPFWFPSSLYEYENAAEDPEGEHMRIVVVKVAEMFTTRVTPEMKDLVDPRKRHVVE